MSLRDVVGHLTSPTRGHFGIIIIDDNEYKELKLFCKNSDQNSRDACQYLLLDLAASCPVVRIRALTIMDYLFRRSKAFRSFACENIRTIGANVGLIENSSFTKLPKHFHSVLSYFGHKCIKSWNTEFGMHYAQLEVFYSVVSGAMGANFDGKRKYENEIAISKLSKLFLSKSDLLAANMETIRKDVKYLQSIQKILDDYILYRRKQKAAFEETLADVRATTFKPVTKPSDMYLTLDELLYNDSKRDLSCISNENDNNEIENDTKRSKSMNNDTKSEIIIVSNQSSNNKTKETDSDDEWGDEIVGSVSESMNDLESQPNYDSFVRLESDIPFDFQSTKNSIKPNTDDILQASNSIVEIFERNFDSVIVSDTFRRLRRHLCNSALPTLVRWQELHKNVQARLAHNNRATKHLESFSKDLVRAIFQLRSELEIAIVNSERVNLALVDSTNVM